MNHRYALRQDQWERIKDMLPGREGHVEPSDITESAPTAGLQQTSTLNAGKDWSAARLVLPRGARNRK